MSSFGGSLMQRFLKESRTLSNTKSDAHHSLEPWRFPLGQYPAKGFKFNASYYVTQILEPLSKWRRTQIGRTNRKLIVHADHARPLTEKMTSQFVEQNSMQRAPHPAYSPDLALFDFYLFGDVKQRLLGCQFADQDSLFQAVSDILMGIEKVALKSVFHNWMERLCQCSATGGEYVE
jgi:hypothetical protein